jgi:hypothetical protein
MWQIVAGQQRVQKRDNLLRLLFAFTDIKAAGQKKGGISTASRLLGRFQRNFQLKGSEEPQKLG